MECTNCTACIDACNFMMDKVGLPQDLIRYASENNIAEGKKLEFTGRMKAYTVILALLIGLMAFLLITRDNIDAHITRSKGQLFTEVDNNKLANFYEIKLINKTNEDIAFNLRLENIGGEIKLVGTDKIIAKTLQQGKANFMIILDKEKVKEYKTNLEIALYDGNKKIRTIKTNFLGPFK